MGKRDRKYEAWRAWVDTLTPEELALEAEALAHEIESLEAQIEASKLMGEGPERVAPQMRALAWLKAKLAHVKRRMIGGGG